MADTRNLVLKGRTWWAQCAVPRPLRPVVGKSNLMLNLRTSDLKIAQRRRTTAMAEFQCQLDAAAGRPRVVGTSTHDGAMSWREAREEAQASGDPDLIETVDILTTDEAERIEEKAGEVAAQRFYRIASGQSTPILHHLETCAKESSLAPNTLVEGRAAVKRFALWA